MRISVSSFMDVPLFADKNVTHLVSIGSPGDHFPPIGQFFGVNKYIHSILRLEFDVEDLKQEQVPNTIDSGFIFPSFEDVRRLINFALEFTNEEIENGHVLFHCHMGISRSTAAAFIFSVIINGGNFDHAWEHLLSARPKADPNILLIKLAEKLLLSENYNYSKIRGMTKFVADKLNLSNYDSAAIHSSIK